MAEEDRLAGGGIDRPTHADPGEGEEPMSDTADTEREPAEVEGPGPELPRDEPPKRAPRRRKGGNRKPRTEAQKAAARANIAKAQASRKGKGTITPAKLRDALAESIRSLAGALMLAGITTSPRLLYDAEIIAGKADELAAEVVAVAERNPAMYAALVTMVKGGQWAKLAALVASVAVPILANHGVLPVEAAELVGAAKPPPREPAAETSPGG
jgi:hypothetical protein